MRVLAVGATGQYGGLVVPALKAQGVQVRALLHDPARRAQAEGAGADQSVVGDLRDASSFRAALDGVEGLFLITPAFAPDATELGVEAVRAAADVGVRRIVFSGVYHPSLSLSNHAAMRPIEEEIYRSGLEFTVLQPAMFMQGLAGSFQSAVQQGVFAMPYSSTSPMTFVDYRDVAEVAALAMSTDELIGGTFELASAGTITRTEIAQLMSEHAGRQIVAVDIPAEVALGEMPAGTARDGLGAMFADYTAHGFRGGNDFVLRSILRRAPRTVAQFIAELPR